jgi:hypothetical protein
MASMVVDLVRLNLNWVYHGGPGFLPARLYHAGQGAAQGKLSETQATHPESAIKRTCTPAQRASIILANLEQRRPGSFDAKTLLGHGELFPSWAGPAGRIRGTVIHENQLVHSCLRAIQAALAADSPPAPRNGIPNAFSKVNPSKSLVAVVAMETVIPLTRSMRSRLSSGKIVCSRRPSE